MLFEEGFKDNKEILMKKWREGMAPRPKLLVKLVIQIYTGNVPFQHIFHEVYIPEDVREIFQICGVDGFLSDPPCAPIGINIEILYNGLVHMCSHSELYMTIPPYQSRAYRKAISMLATLIYECQKYPKAYLEAHYIPKEANVVSE